MTALPSTLRWLIIALLAVATLMLARQSHAQDRVTAADVANAVRNSPHASPWLRANADAVGNLARFESGGRLGIYNGSCCFGVLQLNTQNVKEFAKVEPAVFQTWSLQQQVDAWSKLTTQMLATKPPASLVALGKFDGRTVDGNLVLSCVQLGVGNCQTMINSGKCTGFADINGTTICTMADKMTGGSSGPAPSPGSPSIAGTGTSYNPSWTPSSCVRDGSGGCMSMNAAIAAGFQSGSGISMAKLRSVNQMLLVVVTLLVVGSAMLGVWQRYTRGVIATADLLLYMKRGLIVVCMVFVVMSLF